MIKGFDNKAFTLQDKFYIELFLHISAQVFLCAVTYSVRNSQNASETSCGTLALVLAPEKACAVAWKSLNFSPCKRLVT